MRTLCLCIFAIAYAPVWIELRDSARLEHKRLMSALRSKRYRRAEKLRAKAKRLSVRLAEAAARIAVAEEKARQQELKRRKHASKRQGFMDGWHANADLQDSEQWSKQYRKAFAESRTQRTKFEQQMSGSAVR